MLNIQGNKMNLEEDLGFRMGFFFNLTFWLQQTVLEEL